MPTGEVGQSYSYNFKPLLSVSGDPAFDAERVVFTGNGPLPTGLSLSEAGVLSGTPQSATAGASYQVVATYKTKTGQQTYTLLVNGVYLTDTQISAGALQSCAITTGGAAKCWGSNGYGRLGDGTTTASTLPIGVLR